MYEAQRSPNRPDGYHALVDDLEVELVERYARSQDVLECGCGTGLLLERMARVAKTARGINLSPGMLARARARHLDVEEADVTSIRFADETFDVTCAFKVLAHVPEVGRALAEMARVTRPGGVVIAEFYNPIGLRGLAKWLGPAGTISARTRECDVYTRFESAVDRVARASSWTATRNGPRCAHRDAGSEGLALSVARSRARSRGAPACGHTASGLRPGSTSRCCANLSRSRLVRRIPSSQPKTDRPEC